MRGGRRGQRLSPLLPLHPFRRILGFWFSFGFSAAVFAHGFSPHLDGVSVVDEAIEDAIGDGGIADLVVPLTDRQLRGQNRGATLIAILADLPKVPTFVFPEGGHGPVIDDQYIDAAETRQ
jgi:hypothetical protein